MLPYLAWRDQLKAANSNNVLMPLLSSFRDTPEGFPVLEEASYDLRKYVSDTHTHIYIYIYNITSHT